MVIKVSQPGSIGASEATDMFTSGASFSAQPPVTNDGSQTDTHVSDRYDIRKIC